MEAILSFETLVTTYKTAWRHNPEDHTPQFYYRAHLKSFSCPKIEIFKTKIETLATPVVKNQNARETITILFICENCIHASPIVSF
jgi:hypothetical protein